MAKVAEAAQPAPEAATAPIIVASTEAEDTTFISFKESTNKTDAINAASGACGLGQALPWSKLPCSLTDYGCQDEWFTQYAMERYGSSAQAKAFWLQHSWW